MRTFVIVDMGDLGCVLRTTGLAVKASPKLRRLLDGTREATFATGCNCRHFYRHAYVALSSYLLTKANFKYVEREEAMDLQAIDRQRTELLKIYYRSISTQANANSILEFLLRVIRRAFEDPSKRSLCTNSKTFATQIRGMDGVLAWFVACGWRMVVIEHEEYLQFVYFDPWLVRASLDLLEELLETRKSTESRAKHGKDAAEQEEEVRLAKVRALIAADNARRADRLPLARLK